MIEVIITDDEVSYDTTEDYFRTLCDWAKENVQDGFIGYEIVDVSDISYKNDVLGVYKFTEKKYADWFYLAHGDKNSKVSDTK